MNPHVFHASLASWLAAPGAAAKEEVLPAALSAIAPARLAVHRNTFVATLVDLLAESFPVICALVGDDFFRAMARDCVLSDAPRSPALVEYALDFPAFVAGYSPLAALTFLVEIAVLEAMRLRAFHAGDADALGADAFRSLLHDPHRIAVTRVALHPSAQWLRARHAVHALWVAHHDAIGDMAAADLGGLDLPAPQDVLVCRHGFELQVAALPPGAAEFLDALADGATLAEAFARASAAHPGTDAAALFALLLRHGLAVALHADPAH